MRQNLRDNKYAIAGIIVGVICIMIVCPFVTIWATNTIFGTNVGYNLATWAASAWLTGCLAYRNK